MEPKHHTPIVKQILKMKGYDFLKVGEKDDSVYYMTPNNQIVKFEDADLICFEIFSKILEEELCS